MLDVSWRSGAILVKLIGIVAWNVALLQSFIEPILHSIMGYCQYDMLTADSSDMQIMDCGISDVHPNAYLKVQDEGGDIACGLKGTFVFYWKPSSGMQEADGADNKVLSVAKAPSYREMLTSAQQPTILTCPRKCSSL